MAHLGGGHYGGEMAKFPIYDSVSDLQKRGVREGMSKRPFTSPELRCFYAEPFLSRTLPVLLSCVGLVKLVALRAKPIKVFCLYLFEQQCMILYHSSKHRFLLDGGATMRCWSFAALWCGKQVGSSSLAFACRLPRVDAFGRRTNHGHGHHVINPSADKSVM